MVSRERIDLYGILEIYTHEWIFNVFYSALFFFLLAGIFRP
jgi:hypothetical protein